MVQVPRGGRNRGPVDEREELAARVRRGVQPPAQSVAHGYAVANADDTFANAHHAEPVTDDAQPHADHTVTHTHDTLAEPVTVAHRAGVP